MEEVRRTRLVTAAVLTVVFGSGFVIGFAVDRTALASPPSGVVATDSTEEARTRRPRMYEQVGPDDAQKVLLDSIVQAHRERMAALQKEYRAEYDARQDALIDSARTAIKSVFDPAQAARYDSLTADYDRRQAEREASRGN